MLLRQGTDPGEEWCALGILGQGGVAHPAVSAVVGLAWRVKGETPLKERKRLHMEFP